MGSASIENTPVTSSTVKVNGADLYHEVRGSGPPLLFIAGATGDGGMFQRVAEQLSDDFTTVTYHRRGNSLSPRPDGWASTTIDEQADDAAALLHAQGLAPAVVFGGSAGAVILLNMMLRHPDVLRGAIVQEAVMPMLPHVGEALGEMQKLIEEGLATTGPRGTMEMFLRLNIGDATFENIDPALRERMLGNAEVFFFTELAALSAYMPAAEALAACTVPALVTTGIDSRGNLYHESSGWVATQLGNALQEIPGAHTPYLDHPGELANTIRTFALGLA